jgi:hypothetical protein
MDTFFLLIVLIVAASLAIGSGLNFLDQMASVNPDEFILIKHLTVLIVFLIIFGLAVESLIDKATS